MFQKCTHQTQENQKLTRYTHQKKREGKKKKSSHSCQIIEQCRREMAWISRVTKLHDQVLKAAPKILTTCIKAKEKRKKGKKC